MSGGVFRVRGGSGRAPTTSFFGAIPDRFNMLLPIHFATPGHTFYWDKMIAANTVYQWTIFNTAMFGGANQDTVSLGAFTSAPDGSFAGQKIIESNANSEHYLTAGCSYPAPADAAHRFGSDLRLAVIAKAAERSRIVLQLSDNSASGGSGCRTVFDLAGGQIGVPCTSYGTPGVLPFPIALGQSISSLGDGWYVCTMDMTIGGMLGNAVALASCYVDAGTGTAAANFSYAGDGTSGVYVWRSTMLPPSAWGLSGQRVFYEDFNDPTLANFDLTNSRAQGFTWYLDTNHWPSPSFSGGNNQSAGDLSASGSVLTIAKGPSGCIGIQTAAYDGAGGWVGVPGGWKMPALFEARFAFDQGDNTGIGNTAWWSSSLESAASATHQLIGEMDFLEYNLIANGKFPLGGGFAGDGWDGGGGSAASIIQTSSKTTAKSGYTQWSPSLNYFGGQVVAYLGVLYESTGSPNTGNQPNITPAKWTIYAPISTQPTILNSIIYDPAQQNTYAWLALPLVKGSNGALLSFCNGVFCQQIINEAGAGVINYRPELAEDNVQWMADGTTWPIFISASQLNVSAIRVDWVSVIQ